MLATVPPPRLLAALALIAAMPLIATRPARIGTLPMPAAARAPTPRVPLLRLCRHGRVGRRRGWDPVLLRVTATAQVRTARRSASACTQAAGDVGDDEPLGVMTPRISACRRC